MITGTMPNIRFHKVTLPADLAPFGGYLSYGPPDYTHHHVPAAGRLPVLYMDMYTTTTTVYI